MRKLIRHIGNMSIRTKLILSFLVTSLILLVSNLFLYGEVNKTIHQIDEIYVSNVNLNRLSEALSQTQEDVYEYLIVKSSDALENYYRSEQTYRELLENLNTVATDNEMKLLEKNIKNMSDTYLYTTNTAVQAKRGRNVEKYNASYEKGEQLYRYINSYISSLNDKRFKANTSSYQELASSLRTMEAASVVILILISLVNVLVLMVLTGNIIKPLTRLSKTANQVSGGNMQVEQLPVESRDEVGIVTSAFNHMVLRIQDYIGQIRESMEKEQKMKERELLMETHLKDAQLKYLQAQINPHFLFNSLNAGAQLAMMEDAEQTCLFVEKMADFFRYNVKKMTDDATLGEEIEAVDNYIYILNVRFAGDIHFSKDVDTSVYSRKIPSMILQPIVENAVNYGVRNIDWEGYIKLTVKRQADGTVFIQVADNGKGMTSVRIQEVLEGRAKEKGQQSDSTGVGLDNVISRLGLYYDSEGILSIESGGMDKGTQVTLVLPADETEEGNRDVQDFAG